VGPTPTLPPHHQPPSAGRDRRARRPDPDADRDQVLDAGQPPTTPPAPAAESEREGDLALEDTGVRLHRELADAEPTSRTAEQPEPLGQRLPEPLDASREGVER